jgi:alpha-L-rhamnosidase
MIASSWTKSDGRFTLSVSIPPNTKAEVWIPSQSGQVLANDGKPLPQTRVENGYAIVEVGSGNYSFMTLSVE